MIRVSVKKKLLSADGPMELAVDFEIQKGEWVTFFGKSGAGKTSLLRILAGLTVADEGVIEVFGEVWFDSRRRINLPVSRRKIGFVFQEYHLFPHLTVFENLRYALADKNEISLVKNFLRLVELEALENRKPHQLSGGQRQRVALARVFLRNPEVLLLDEPLAAIDGALRLRLQDELTRLCRQRGLSAICVSHELSEVFRLSSRVFVLEKGQVVQSGAPTEVFLENHVSGKVKFSGHILAMAPDNGMVILNVQIGNTVIKMVVTQSEADSLFVGDRVLVAAKAFNPLIFKV